MKKFFSILIAISSLIAMTQILGLMPITDVPQSESNALISASLIKTDKQQKKASSNKTMTLLKLLEQVIDKERNFEKGKVLIQQSLQRGKEEQLLKLYEAKILTRSLDFKKAEQLLSTIDQQEIIPLKTAVLIAQGERNIAREYLQTIIDEHPDPKAKLTALSLLSLYKNYDKHRDSDVSYLWTLFAQRLGELGELEVSQYLAEKAIEKSPQYRDAWIIKGYDELMRDKPSNAEISLLRAYELDPGNPNIQYLLGLTYAKLKNTSLSTQYLLYAKQNFSSLSDQKDHYQETILEQLIENAIISEDYALAGYYAEELLVSNPDKKEVREKLIWLYTVKLHKSDKALLHAEALIEEYPSEKKGYDLKSWIYSKIDDLEKDKKELEKTQALLE